MMKLSSYLRFILAFSLVLTQQVVANDPLPSWHNNPSKKAIISFVEQVTKPGSTSYVPVNDRIATFDNDGTLWPEQPIYFQLYFALERIKQLAPKNPQWKTQEPFASLLKGDITAALAGGEHAILEIVKVSHAGMTTDEFNQAVKQWVKAAKHPETNKLFTEMVYQPMLEVLAYLRANEFKTYIVSGGGISFMRAWSEQVYGIAPEQVIGSSMKTEFKLTNDKPQIIRLPEIAFINDKAGKPIAINQHIGKRPIAAFGNSDGDLQMLQWTTAGKGPRFALYVHHTDDKREWAYDRDSHIGRFDKGLDEASKKGWTVVDMKKDWKVIYPYQLN